MASLASFLIGFAARRKGKRFEEATHDPAGTQARLLQELMERNKDTEYGRAHGFAKVRSLADYRSVPLVDYEDIREHIERVTRGEKNILTAEDPVLFAQTSGTTRRSHRHCTRAALR